VDEGRKSATEVGWGSPAKGGKAHTVVDLLAEAAIDDACP